MKKIIIVAAIFFCSRSQAQDSLIVNALDEVSITASRVDLKQSQTGKVVSIIDQATIQRNAGKTLAELLNTQAAIFINGANNNLGANQELYFRGSASGNVLILLDGVPISDPSYINNSFDLNNINLNQIEKIEILRGAQSTLWGSDAVAGVINIISKKITPKLSSNTKLTAGSFNTVGLNTGLSSRIGKIGFLVNFSYLKSGGFSSSYDSTGKQNFDKDGFLQHGLQTKFTYDFNKYLSFGYAGNLSNYKTDIDAGAFIDDKDYSTKSSNIANNFSFIYQKNRVKINFIQSFVQTNRHIQNDSSDISGFAKWSKEHYQGSNSISDLYGNIQLSDKYSVVIGTQFLKQNTAQSYESISDYGYYASVPLGKDTSNINNWAFYSSFLMFFKNGFNLEIGLRNNQHSIYGNNNTYTFNPSFRFNDKHKVFVNISSAYKTPSLYQLFSEFGNKKLAPESSENFEVGVQSKFFNKKLDLRLVGFLRNSKNIIVFYSDPISYASYYINQDKQKNKGFELETNWIIGEKITWTSNLNYVEGQGSSEGIFAQNLYRRPKTIFNSSLFYSLNEKWSISPTFRYVGKRLKGLYDAGDEYIAAYHTFDCFVQYKASKKMEMYLQLKNLTNQKYFEVLGYNTKPRHFNIGLNFNF